MEEKEMLIRTRIAHTTADVEFSKTFQFHKDAIPAGVKAIEQGKNIFTDVSMVSSGIRPRIQSGFEGELLCFLYDDEIGDEAKRRGTTKSAAAMTMGVPFYEGGIVAIGNAPTALFELIDMIKEGTARPALIVGFPVGFVGGSPIAAAIVNGIIALSNRDN